MSLKHVHLAFIVLCVALMLLCGFMALQIFRVDGGWGSAASAGAALAGAGALIQYERGFLARWRKAGLR